MKNLIGRKSKVRELIIPNERDFTSPFKVKILANKNHGICDISISSNDRVIECPILSSFQGRQYDDAYTITRLENVIVEFFNLNL